jgi:hypothetical protein
MQVGLRFNGTHKPLVYADDVNILGGSMQTINKNTEALVVFSKEIGLKVNADKTKYVAESRQQNAGKCHNIKIIIVPLKGWKSSNIWKQI